MTRDSAVICEPLEAEQEKNKMVIYDVPNLGIQIKLKHALTSITHSFTCEDVITKQLHTR